MRELIGLNMANIAIVIFGVVMFYDDPEAKIETKEKVVFAVSYILLILLLSVGVYMLSGGNQ